MTSLSQDTYAAPGLILSALGSGGAGGQVSTFTSDVFITSTLTVLEVNAGTLSTIFLEAESAFISSISTAALILDAATLTTAGGTELLLNGIPLATTSNISSLADWSFDPAVSTLNMNSFCTIGSSGFFGSGTVSSLNVEAQTGLISSLVCQDISTVTFTAFSTIHAISSISSTQIEAQSGIFSSINGATFPQVIPTASTVSTFVDLYTSSFTVSSIQTSSAAASDLNISAQRYINTATTGISTTVDGGADVFTNSFYRVTAKNGNRGEISMTAGPGLAGIRGEINLTANGGTVPGTGIGNGGIVNITANSAPFALSNLTSAINLSAAGINSYAGAIPAVGSLLGYNFIYGTLGVNICAGLPPGALPNFPGTTYIYGTTGVEIGSALYASDIYGYWAGLPSAPSNLTLYGRQTVAGDSYVNINNAGTISFDIGGAGAITNLQTINGTAYPPPEPLDLSTNTVTASNFVSTPSLLVSSINNASYPPAASVPQDLTISSLTAADYISSAVVQGVSSVTGPFLNIAGGDALNLYSDNGVSVVGGVELYANAVFASSITFQDATSSFITGLSSLNGVAYPPPASVPENLVVSTLTVSSISYLPKIESCSSIGWAAGAVPTVSFSPTETTVSYGPLSVSSIIDVSTINGQPYVAGGGVNPNLALSTLTLNGGSFSLNTIFIEHNAQPEEIGLNIGVRAATASSGYIGFSRTGYSNADDGIMSLHATDINSENTLVVSYFSTALSVIAPIKVSNVYATGFVNTSSIIGVSSINGVAYPDVTSMIYQATYYNSVAQNLTSGNTDITFDTEGAWNNTGGYITHVSGTADFTVVQTGLYQLEFNALVLVNNGTWLTTSNRTCNIDITRSPTAEQAVITNTALQGVQNYGQSVSGTIYLVAGDVINLRLGNIYTGGSPTPPQAQGLQNTFDLNTFFTWTFISLGGATAYQNPPPVIQAAGTTALVPTSANTTYILTSGATQNFTTAGLGAGNAGSVWYVKNAASGDITIQHNGTNITGDTSTAHQGTGAVNSSSQILYWNGTDLIMY
jgi:hypothetical protein